MCVTLISSSRVSVRAGRVLGMAVPWRDGAFAGRSSGAAGYGCREASWRRIGLVAPVSDQRRWGMRIARRR
jgi:hypothetical protein